MLAVINAFYQSGMRRVILDTDAESFTDSSKFYTSLGMSIDAASFGLKRKSAPDRRYDGTNRSPAINHFVGDEKRQFE